MEISLVILAAGLGVRYGGNKQIDGVGPNGELLMEYSIHDALRAGFSKVVFIIRPEMRDLLEDLCGYLRRRTAKDGNHVEVAYACQDLFSLPPLYTVPKGRTKPFGTVHALLCAADELRGPFCVVNADDYYGINAYRTMYQALAAMPDRGQAAMVGYLLENTVSLYGTVSRGICTVKDGRLRSVQETKKIQLCPDGTLRDLDTDCPLELNSTVSMNCWGFTPSIIPVLRACFDEFLRGPQGRERTCECLLPVVVDHLVRRGELEVSVFRSDDRWFGMTYREDREAVVQMLRKLHEAGQYPSSLRE